ncbi:hypothetical protein HWV07_07745 [Natronomonas salina]|uniref:hypothetical protein n=1 Tax=Natronomonas salina TaxID=1710540 RepID=UPI0015B735F2|nr:hypothetical protein [Natronomonas salina]QLD88927.1 hypothetical protein HWV07_07745 [Natronomonas salina]
MPSDTSGVDDLASSLHRTALGTLLAIVGILGVGLARRLPDGDYLIGLLGVVLALGAVVWISSLLGEGLRER